MKKKLISSILCVSMLFGMVAGLIPFMSLAIDNVEDYVIEENDVPLRLYYDEEASHGVSQGYDDVEASFGSGGSLIEAHPNDDWERWSIPLGNGYFGANVFGRTGTERIQLTEKTLANPYRITNGSANTDGLNNFSETYIDFGHTNSSVTNYSRELDLKTAISTVKYDYNGVTYNREYFTSYPDKAMVIKLDSSVAGQLSFVLRPTVPYEQEYMNAAGDRGGKTGTVTSTVSDGVGYVTLSGKLEYFDIDFVGLYKVYTSGGTVSATTATNKDGDTDGTITVSGADSAYIVITMGTDYELVSEQFTNSGTNKPTFSTDLEDATAKVQGYMSAVDSVISGKSFTDAYAALKTRHLNDYQELFGRVTLDLGFASSDFDLTTDQLLANYKNGSGSRYLEALYFQYGRYLLIASSRKGALPANLQGTWNRYNHAPWSAGYWHNINVQMNYWPAFSTNLSETFEAYVDYNSAYMEKAESGASSVVNKHNPSASGKDGGNGWSIETGGYVNDINPSTSIGNLGFTTQLFWEYYEYTQDKTILREVVYPVLVGAARFITKMVREDADGNYIAIYSDSPEQYVNGVWYYTDKGTGYAQQFAYQNNYNLLLAAKELGISENDMSHEDYAILQTVLGQIDKYDPVRIGLSGQVKEFFEEEKYGDMGEYTHRHISQLVGLYPGNVINGTTPAWLDAAEYVLTQRGDNATGWGVAHRLNLWARVQNGERAHDLLEQLLKVNTATNLWDLHPPFQIDGNLGGTAGISEMLLQSHAGYIEPLAAIPAAWSEGSYTGLVARGNFEVSAAWADNTLTSLNIKSLSGEPLSVKYGGIQNATVCDLDGKIVNYTVSGDGIITFDTEAGETYVIFGFEKQTKPAGVTNLKVESEFLSKSTFTWDASSDAIAYNVYVAKESAPDYTLLTTTKNTSYVYTPKDGENARLTFAVTAINVQGVESERTLVYRNPDDASSAVDDVSANVINGELQVTVKSNVYAETFKLYSKTSSNDEWTLVQESKYPIIIQPNFDSKLLWGVSVSGRYSAETEIVRIKNFGTSAGDDAVYDGSNILTGSKFVATDEGNTYKHNSTDYGDYAKLTDGIFDTANGRFSTLATSDAVLEGVLVLPHVYTLGELRIYDFNAWDSSANYVGSHLKVEVYYGGVWTTVKEYSTNAELLALRKTDGNGKYIAVDLSMNKAQKIRLRLDTPVHTGSEQCSISLNEIQCTGILYDSSKTYTPVDNLFTNHTFEKTDPNSGGIWLPYDNITDGLLGQNGWTNDDRFATSSGNSADGTIDFGGKVYDLYKLRVQYTGGVNDALCGKDFNVFVFRNGEWKQVVAKVYDTAVVDITFDLEGVEAEKLRFTVSAQRDDGNYISIAEMSCTGYEIVGAEIAAPNILLGTPADKVTVSGATLHSSFSDLTKAFDGIISNDSRYAIWDTVAPYSHTIEIELDKTYALYTLAFYPFYNADEKSRSDDTKIELFYGGAWVTVAEGLEIAASYCTEVFLGGAKANKIRITFNNTTWAESATLREIQCSGIEVAESPQSLDNVFTGYVFKAGTGVSVYSPYTYDKLTDGVSDAWGDYRFATSANSNGKHVVDATLDFNGGIYTLNNLTVVYTGTQYCGNDFTFYVYRNGQWAEVVNKVYDTAVSSMTFDLGGVEAEKVRIYVSDKRSDGSYVGIPEISCTGYELYLPEITCGDTDVLSGTTSEQLSLVGDNIKPHSSVPDLSAAFDGNMSTRYATYGSGAYSLEITLNNLYALNAMYIYAYSDGADSGVDYARSDDTTVDVYIDGVWIRVTPSFKLVKDDKTIVLFDRVKAEKIRINFNNTNTPSNTTSIYEIKCYGNTVSTGSYVEDTESNVLLNTQSGSLSISGENASMHPSFNDLTKAFDGIKGDNDNRYALYDKAPYTYSLEIALKAPTRLYTMRIYPFMDGNDTSKGYARSDDTTVEVYINGGWVTAHESFKLGTDLYTEISLGGIEAEKIRINFKNTSGTSTATICEITCTTALPTASDRTPLLEAYKELDNLETNGIGEETIKQSQLDAMRELLMDTEADANEIFSYIDTVSTTASELNDKLTSGKISTEEYGNFEGYNLTLSDTVGISMYGEFDSAPDNSVVILKYADTTEMVDLDELEVGNDGRSVLSLNLCASQMTEDIAISVIFDGKRCTEQIVTSIRNYADTVIGDEKYEAENPGINDLLRSMLNYGAYAQMYFNYNVENLANSGIYTDENNPVLNGDFSGIEEEKPIRTGEVTGITPAGWTLALESDINVRFYFATNNIHKYEFSVVKPDGLSYALEAQYYQDGVYRVEVATDDASLIDNKYYLTITNIEDGSSLTVEFSAMMYVNKILSGAVSASDGKLDNMARAIKLYCEAANAYRGE